MALPRGNAAGGACGAHHLAGGFSEGRREPAWPGPGGPPDPEAVISSKTSFVFRRHPPGVGPGNKISEASTACLPENKTVAPPGALSRAEVAPDISGAFQAAHGPGLKGKDRRADILTCNIFRFLC